MDTERLGMTDRQVSPITFGTWQLGGDWGAFDEREAIAAIRHARELGITLFDTAQGAGFGASERLLGRALRDELDHHRDDVAADFVLSTADLAEIGRIMAGAEAVAGPSPESV